MYMYEPVSDLPCLPVPVALEPPASFSLRPFSCASDGMRRAFAAQRPVSSKHIYMYMYMYIYIYMYMYMWQ